MNKLRISCKGAAMIGINDLEYLQGNLKNLSEDNYRKLKKEIIELGFSEPVSVWKNNGKNYLLNGTQRTRTLRKMIEEKEIESCEIPCNWIDAKDQAEAKKKVLALTSQYGEITSDGLYEFMNEANLKMEEIVSSFRFPEIDFELFQVEFGNAPLEDMDAQSKLDGKTSVCCPKCGHVFTP